MDNDKLVPLILVEYFCKMLGNIIDKLRPILKGYRFFKKLVQQAS